jgi:hypothetical protein
VAEKKVLRDYHRSGEFCLDEKQRGSQEVSLDRGVVRDLSLSQHAILGPGESSTRRGVCADRRSHLRDEGASIRCRAGVVVVSSGG